MLTWIVKFNHEAPLTIKAATFNDAVNKVKHLIGGGNVIISIVCTDFPGQKKQEAIMK